MSDDEILAIEAKLLIEVLATDETANVGKIPESLTFRREVPRERHFERTDPSRPGIPVERINQLADAARRVVAQQVGGEIARIVYERLSAGLSPLPDLQIRSSYSASDPDGPAARIAHSDGRYWVHIQGSPIVASDGSAPFEVPPLRPFDRVSREEAERAIIESMRKAFGGPRYYADDPVPPASPSSGE